MNKLTTFTLTQLETEFSLAQLADIYNKCATELGRDPVKKFADKKSGIRRTNQIQLDYTVEYSKQVRETVEKTVARGKYTMESRVVVTTDISMTGGDPAQYTAHELLQSIIFGLTDGSANDGYGQGPTVAEVISEFKRLYKQPRGQSEVNDAFARGYLTGAIRRGYVVVDEE